MNIFNKSYLVGVLGVVFSSVVSAAAPSFSITPASPSVAPGEQVTVAVNYDGDGSGAYNVGFKLALDMANVEAGSVSVVCNGPFYGLTSATCTNWSETNQSGQIGATYLPAKEVPTTAEIMKITFTVSGSAADGDTIAINTSEHEFTDAPGVNNIPDGGSTGSIVTVRVPVTQYALTATTGGNGSVSCTPAGNVAAGASVTCTASPAAGYVVDAWTAPSACAGDTCTFNMPAADTTVNVTFKAVPPATYSVTTTTTTNGSIACTPVSGVAGTQVSCTATPGNGYQLSAWSGACSGSTSPCTFTLNGNAAVGATFVPLPPATYSVTTTTTTNGSIACTPVSGVAGTQVSCTATPGNGYELSAWSGACSGSTSPCTFTLNGDATVGATFSAIPPTYTVTTATTTNGSIVCAPLSGLAGTQVSCTANSDNGYELSAWSGACSGSTSPCTFTLNSDATVGAAFSAVDQPFTVVSSVVGNGSGSVSCTSASGTITAANPQVSVSCTATPDAGMKFAGWSLPSTCGMNNPCTFNATPGSNSVVALFVDPSQARAIPSVGLFGMLAMLASLFGAATMVLRRKQS